MSNRKRTNPLQFYVSTEELEIINSKMDMLGTNNLCGYLRKMAIDGYIIEVDHSDIKKMTYEMQKIGTNINQIAKRVNSTNTIYDEDIFEIKEQMKKIWQLQRYILSNQP